MPRWYHAPDEQAEYWFGGSDTREEAITKGRTKYDREPFCVALGTPSSNRLDIFQPDVTPVTLAFDEANEENYGEDGEGGPNHWDPEACADLSRRLNAVFAEWAQTHGYERGWMLDFTDQEDVRPKLCLATAGGQA